METVKDRVEMLAATHVAVERCPEVFYTGSSKLPEGQLASSPGILQVLNNLDALKLYKLTHFTVLTSCLYASHGQFLSPVQHHTSAKVHHFFCFPLKHQSKYWHQI